MKTMIGLAVCLAMGPVAAAQEAKQAEGVSQDAMKILKASEAALKKVTVVRYQASYKGTKWIEAMVPAVEGAATIGKRSKWDVDPFYVEVKLKKFEGGAPVQLYRSAGLGWFWNKPGANVLDQGHPFAHRADKVLDKLYGTGSRTVLAYVRFHSLPADK